MSARVPRRNRVAPSGEIVAVDARGTMMGNRGGCLHDRDGAIVATHRSRAWLICLLEFKGRARQVMSPGLYTELFFLDEATALAAGHRPCFECRRADYGRFAQAMTRREGHVSVGVVDGALHPWRLPLGADRPTWRSRPASLPDGSIVRDGGHEWLVVAGAVRRWSPAGYGPAVALPRGTVDVLTPKPTVQALARGYPAGVHPSGQL